MSRLNARPVSHNRQVVPDAHNRDRRTPLISEVPADQPVVPVLSALAGANPAPRATVGITRVRMASTAPIRCDSALVSG